MGVQTQLYAFRVKILNISKTKKKITQPVSTYPLPYHI